MCGRRGVGEERKSLSFPPPCSYNHSTHPGGGAPPRRRRGAGGRAGGGGGGGGRWGRTAAKGGKTPAERNTPAGAVPVGRGRAARAAGGSFCPGTVPLGPGAAVPTASHPQLSPPPWMAFVGDLQGIRALDTCLPWAAPAPKFAGARRPPAAAGRA